MASAELSRRVEKVVGYPPLSAMSDGQRREFHEALLEADLEQVRRERAEAMAAAVERGLPLEAVGEAFGVSKQRVGQIMAERRRSV